MKKSKESTPETKTKCNRSLRFKEQRGIIQLQFFKRIAKVPISCAISRIQSTINHRLYFLVTRKRLCTRSLIIGNCIADSCIAKVLNTCGNISNHTGSQLITRNELSCSEITDFYNFCSKSGRHHTDLRSFFNTAIHNTAENDNSLICIIDRVKDQRLQRSLYVSLRSRNLRNDLFQNFFNIQSCLSRNSRGIMSFQTDHIFDLIHNTIRLCTRKIDLIDDRKNIQIMIQCQINIRQCLCFDSLRRIHNQDRAITGSKASGYFIVKIDMSWRIDQVKNIFFSVAGFIYNSNSLRLNRDTTLTLKIHIIQYLRLHLTLCQGTGLLNNTVSQCRLTMVYMCNNAEITDFTLVYHSAKFLLMYSHLFIQELSSFH